MFHVKHLTQPPIHTTISIHNHNYNKGVERGETPESQSTHEKGGSQGAMAPEPILERKKTISFPFSSIIISPKEGGFQGGGFPLAEIETRSVSLYLLLLSLYLIVSPCSHLLLFSLPLIVCLWCLLNLHNHQPIQHNQYTMQPIQQIHSHQPIHNTASKGQSTPPKFSSIPFHSFCFHWIDAVTILTDSLRNNLNTHRIKYWNNI